MRRIVLAELRDSWAAWLGVSLGFVMTGFSVALSALIVRSALAAGGTVVPEPEALTYAFIGGINLVLCVVVGLSVVATGTGLVVDSRRGAVARLALSGATPVGVVVTILSQLTAVALASALVGNLLAAVALGPALLYLMAERGSDSAGIAVPPVVDPGVLLAVDALWVLVALAGGYRQASRASRIPPVEALRQAQGLAGRRPRAVGRGIRAAVALLFIAGMFAAVPLLAQTRTKETFSQVMQLNLLTLVVVGWLLAELMPALVRPLTATWTRLVPTRDPIWGIARATVAARAERLAGSVTPVMFTIGLTFGVLGLPATYNAIFAAAGIDVRLEHVGAATFLADLGLALLIALCGSVGSLFMMSRQRDAESALLGIAGATPAQRTSAAVGEAVIVTGTAAILGVVMVAVAYGHLAFGTPAAGLAFRLSVPVGPFLVALVVTGAITVAATVLPTRRSLRLAEPRVVARFVAE